MSLVGTTFQIATICIVGAEHARRLILDKKPGQTVAIVIANMMMLYSAVTRFLVAMTQFQYSRRTRRPRGKHVYYEDVICKMASIQYTIECAAYCLVMLATNSMGPAYYFSMLAPPVGLIACILVWVTIVRNVS